MAHLQMPRQKNELVQKQANQVAGSGSKLKRIQTPALFFGKQIVN